MQSFYIFYIANFSLYVNSVVCRSSLTLKKHVYKKLDLYLHTECIFNAMTDAILKGTAYY